MTWHVYLGNRLVGKVIAASHDEAMSLARLNYPGFDFEPMRVELAPRKRNQPPKSET